MSKVQRGNGAPDQANHDKDMGLRSITPTTHLKRDLYRDAADLHFGGLPGNIEDAIFYQDCYKHDTWLREIVSFGINVYNVGIRPALVDHNAEQQSKLAGLGTISNASSNPQNYAKIVKQILLTQCEKDLMQSAASYLATTVRKVVLVDTFTRILKSDGVLKIGDIIIPSSNTEPLATHTVVLYKNLAGVLLVIDPNSYNFSGHLQHATFTLKCNMLVSNSPSDAHKIYASKPITTPKTGPSANQFRDCTDIAVKLAALLDMDPANYTDIDSVMKSRAVQLVSNKSLISQLPEKLVENVPCRIKQVSHLVKLCDINDDLLKYSDSLKKKEIDATVKLAAAQATAKATFDTEVATANAVLDSEVLTLVGRCAIDAELGGSYA